jgi:hypothetical protein
VPPQKCEARGCGSHDRASTCSILTIPRSFASFQTGSFGHEVVSMTSRSFSTANLK